MFLYGRGLKAPVVPPASKSATQPLQPLDVHIETNVEIAEEMRPVRKKRRWGRRIAALLFLGLLGGGVYKLLTTPELLNGNLVAQLGEQIPWQEIKAWVPESRHEQFDQFVANLPWEREKRLRILRADPLEVVSLKLLNTSRDGTPLPQQKDKYLDTEVQYLTWEVELKNKLAGMEGANYRLEGRFFDPEGRAAGQSEGGRFVRSEEDQLTLRGVTLLEGIKERAKGNYQFELYWGDKKLASQTLRIDAEPKKVVKAEPTPGGISDGAPSVASRPMPPLPDPVIEERNRRLAEEAKRAAEDAKRQALVMERSKKPLDLISVSFSNTSKEGKRLSGQNDRFPASKIRFIGWEAKFRNRLLELAPAYHRIEATYYAPNGQPLGTVQDAKQVELEQKDVTFTARIGNSTGGAFAPGTYRVDFYVNGYPFTSKKFIVEDDREEARVKEPPPAPRESPLPPRESPPSETPIPRTDLASLLQHHTGSMLGLFGSREVELELNFQPQTDGRLYGDVIIHESGFAVSPLQGRINGNQIEFRSPTGRGTFHFRGWRDEDRLTGTYTIIPSGNEGRWSVRIR
jgi:hypothetical protein